MSDRLRIEIENLKCGGCEKSILSALSAMPGVSAVQVDHDSATVSLAADPSLRGEVVARLTSMGYPEKGTVQGLASGLAVAKSYFSCAIGRIT